MIKKVFILLFLLLTWLTNSYATHNRAGEIIYEQIGESTYRITVITYTKESSHQADRCELEINYGDGTPLDTIPRINGYYDASQGCPYGEPLGNDVKMNIHVTTHTFPGPGTYRLSVESPNRNSGVINIPNSVNIPFFIYSYLTINPFGNGFNNSPVLLNPPIDEACGCKPFIHNPGAYDSDGDSLTYTLVPCRGENGNEISGYTFPVGAIIDKNTGDLVWTCPGPEEGEYNFAILIEEWKRSGTDVTKVGSVLRDMQVTVRGNCRNDPPEIVAMQDTCVIAGAYLKKRVRATDKDSLQLVTLTATSELFVRDGVKAEFDSVAPANPVESEFRWQTQCNDVRIQPYTLSVKAVDNFYENQLVDFETYQITVIGPKPILTTVLAQGTSLVLNWSQYTCSNIKSFLIYRRDGSNPFVPEVCETGLSADKGYSLIKTINDENILTFIDDNNGEGLKTGTQYCYRIVAVFENDANSIVSDELCGELVRDLPLITHVSVVSTDINSGEVLVRWSKPLVGKGIGIDTIQNPGPYSVKIMHKIGNEPFQEINNTSSTYFSFLNDTIFNHLNINTKDTAHVYRLDFYSNSTNLVGSSKTASSPFLKGIPNDNRITLKWEGEIPWTNYYYRIYKKNLFGTEYELLDSTRLTEYTDYYLLNNVDYCYYIITEGEYSVNHVSRPLFNASQKLCVSPKDRTAPCQTSLSITPNCDGLKNDLTWLKPDTSCADDVVKYRIYRAVSDTTKDYVFVKEFTNQEFAFTHDSLLESIAGCYVVTAIDSFNNESVYSAQQCADNCPVYNLPNVFTPNGDKINDYFMPLPDMRFVKDIELEVYNRWGSLVFKSNDKYIRWDGTHYESKKRVSDGVYYYICKVNKIRLKGLEKEYLKGFVHIYNDGGSPTY